VPISASTSPLNGYLSLMSEDATRLQTTGITEKLEEGEGISLDE